MPEVIPAYVRNIMDWEEHAAYLGVNSLGALMEYLGNTILSFAPAYLAGSALPVPYSPGLPSIWGIPESLITTYADSVMCRPLAHAQTVAEVDAYPWPSGSAEAWDFVGMRKHLLGDATHARLSPSWTPVFSELCELFGMELAMVNLYWNRPVLEAALARLDDFYTEFFRNLLATCGDQLDIFGLGDDFAGNRGLLIRPDLWRAMFKPLYAKWLGMAKAKGLTTLMHTCGLVRSVLPDLIDCGLDAWQTVQTHLPGQAASQIKAEFGERLAFVGAIDTTSVLGTASPEAVCQHVQRQIEVLGAGGGYICAPDHTIMAGTPSANVAALYTTTAKFRKPGYTVL